MYAITIDAGARSYLALCGCGWRSDIAATRIAALTAGQRHIFRAHDDRPSAARIASTLSKATTRATRR